MGICWTSRTYTLLAVMFGPTAQGGEASVDLISLPESFADHNGHIAPQKRSDPSTRQGLTVPRRPSHGKIRVCARHVQTSATIADKTWYGFPGSRNENWLPQRGFPRERGDWCKRGRITPTTLHYLRTRSGRTRHESFKTQRVIVMPKDPDVTKWMVQGTRIRQGIRSQRKKTSQGEISGTWFAR